MRQLLSILILIVMQTCFACNLNISPCPPGVGFSNKCSCGDGLGVSMVSCFSEFPVSSPNNYDWSFFGECPEGTICSTIPNNNGLGTICNSIPSSNTPSSSGNAAPSKINPGPKTASKSNPKPTSQQPSPTSSDMAQFPSIRPYPSPSSSLTNYPDSFGPTNLAVRVKFSKVTLLCTVLGFLRANYQ